MWKLQSRAISLLDCKMQVNIVHYMEAESNSGKTSFVPDGIRMIWKSSTQVIHYAHSLISLASDYFLFIFPLLPPSAV